MFNLYTVKGRGGVAKTHLDARDTCWGGAKKKKINFWSRDAPSVGEDLTTWQWGMAGETGG